MMDPDGNVFIDMMAAVAVNNIGHSHPEVIEAIKSQAEKIMHTVDAPNPRKIGLMEASWIICLRPHSP